ncbi:tetratricopeptide repeat protein, partial [Streptomyces sp. NPDC056549]|uniref:tetratricopeptide repeat protein n=1 Tax=Streptomyces sp. NPDC056549 TaxID=3345864 RepID=UPI0036B83531
SVFCERVDRRWWEHRVKDLMAHFNDRASHPGLKQPVTGDDRESLPELPTGRTADTRSEADLLAETTVEGEWSRAQAWHALISLLWSQGRLAEAENLLRQAAGTDPAAASELVRLLRITDRREEGRMWQSDDALHDRLRLLVERGELGAAADVVASHDHLRQALLELFAIHGLGKQAMEIADAWAREGDPAPALELYRRSQQWERVLAVLPPNAPREMLSRVPGVVDYGVEALVRLGRLSDAVHEARRRFEAGDAFYASTLADLLVRDGRADAAEALLNKIMVHGGGYHAQQARDQLGRLLSSQGRHEEAIRILRDQSLLVTHDPSPRPDPVDRVALARALAGAGAVDQAVRELLSHLEQYPPYATCQVWLTMAELLTEHGRAGDVPKIVGAAASTDSGARYALARHYLSAARHDAAVELLLARLDDDRQFHDSMLCSVTLATLLRDQGRTDEYRLVLWRTAHLNWLESVAELAQEHMDDEVSNVIWAVDASGLVLPGNFHGLRSHTVRDDLRLSPDNSV